jgi:hypothetical protein
MWTAEKETIEKEVENEFKRLNGGIRWIMKI